MNENVPQRFQDTIDRFIFADLLPAPRRNKAKRERATFECRMTQVCGANVTVQGAKWECVEAFNNYKQNEVVRTAAVYRHTPSDETVLMEWINFAEGGDA